MREKYRFGGVGSGDRVVRLEEAGLGVLEQARVDAVRSEGFHGGIEGYYRIDKKAAAG